MAEPIAVLKMPIYVRPMGRDIEIGVIEIPITARLTGEGVTVALDEPKRADSDG